MPAPSTLYTIRAKEMVSMLNYETKALAITFSFAFVSEASGAVTT